MRSIILFVFLLLAIPLIGQQEKNPIPLPIFEPFKGKVYDMPKLEQKHGKVKNIKIQEYYSDTIYTYPVLGDITLNKLDVPETYVNEGVFPGVDKTIKFAMILHSKMEVQLDACYEFDMTSDDGSRLWINEIQVVQNDGGHGMRSKKDTVALRKGNYDVKVWYFQGMPDRFGLKMNTKFVGKIETCQDKQLEKENTFKKIVFDNVYFDTDKYTIKKEGQDEIEKIASIINDVTCNTIKIVGHTDSQGTDYYNEILSENRAHQVFMSLQTLIEDLEIDYVVLGNGESEPLEDNSTSAGRKKNRRVEIFLIN